MEDNLNDASASESPSVGLEGEAPAAPAAAPATEQAESGGSPAVPQQFTVKVGGEEMQVSLEEALQGYQRQEDYTRKTQEVASQREQLGHADRLWQAIETNPQATIQALAEAYGVGATQAPDATNPFAEDESSSAPADPWKSQVEQFMQQAQLQQLQSQIDRELQTVHSTYGVNFKDEDLLQFAVDKGIPDLDAAFKAFAFDGLQRAASTRATQQRKENAPPIAGGHGVTPGTVVPGSGSALPSLEDAFAAAEAAHGLS